jgi:hypothetical protein
MSYATRLDPLVRRQLARWRLPDGILIDPENRLLKHRFLFQVFYHSDEQTLLVRRGAYITTIGF